VNEREARERDTVTDTRCRVDQIASIDASREIPRERGAGKKHHREKHHGWG